MEIKNIRVTEHDIETGQTARRNSNKGILPSKPSETCAVALALKREFGAEKVNFGYSGGTVGDVKVDVSQKHSETVREWIYNHDDLKSVSPFEFEVEVTA